MGQLNARSFASLYAHSGTGLAPDLPELVAGDDESQPEDGRQREGPRYHAQVKVWRDGVSVPQNWKQRRVAGGLSRSRHRQPLPHQHSRCCVAYGSIYCASTVCVPDLAALSAQSRLLFNLLTTLVAACGPPVYSLDAFWGWECCRCVNPGTLPIPKRDRFPEFADDQSVRREGEIICKNLNGRWQHPSRACHCEGQNAEADTGATRARALAVTRIFGSFRT